MTHAPKLRAFLPLAVAAVALILTSRARAAGFADWFGWGTPTTVTAGYAPGYGYYYAPTTAYRTLYSPVAVTSYRPATACSACGDPAVTSYMPVTTYVQRPILQAYTAYQPVYTAAPAPACAACGTAYYPPAPACSSCGCATGGCATGGCSTCGRAACGYARPACPTCGGGCASGACGAALAPAAAPVYSAASGSPPTLSYMSPISSTPYAPTPYAPTPYAPTPYAPTQVYAGASSSYPVATTYTTPAYGSSPTVTYAAPTYGAPTYVVPAPTTGALSPTYAMPLLPGSPSVSSGIVRPSTPTLAPPAPTSADIAPSLPGPIPPTPLPPASSTQPRQNSALPRGTQTETPKAIGEPTVPSPAPLTPIPDNRNPTPPSAGGSRPPIDPNSRTASSMPMLRPGSYLSAPWPIAKTTAALMPVVPVDADGWHAAR